MSPPPPPTAMMMVVVMMVMMMTVGGVTTTAATSRQWARQGAGHVAAGGAGWTRPPSVDHVGLNGRPVFGERCMRARGGDGSVWVTEAGHQRGTVFG